MIWLTMFALTAAQETDCRNPEVQQEMNFCAAQEARRQDQALNAIWPQVLARIRSFDQQSHSGNEGERRLRAAQRAWIAFRDAQCSLEGVEALGGSLEPLLVGTCFSSMTERRIAELREVLQPQQD